MKGYKKTFPAQILIGWLTGLLMAWVGCAPDALPDASVPAVALEEPATVVYLVRHAEKADDGTPDPPLTEAGRERAAQLAHILADAGLTHIYSTGYKRTQETVQPLAEQAGLSVESYDPVDLGGFAARLQATPGRFLISGHSNTTPELVRYLGGEPGAPIDEAEYDRLYIVVLKPGRPTTLLLRYGMPFGR